LGFEGPTDLFNPVPVVGVCIILQRSQRIGLHRGSRYSFSVSLRLR